MTQTPPPRATPGPRKKKPPRIDLAHGVLLIDKPPGMTSHDVVSRIRHRFSLRKVGHGGTLDPQATGVLPILLGRGTKLSARIMNSDKTYEGVFTLGLRTDTQDADGVILEERDPSGIGEEPLRREMTACVGDRLQTPPMVSAVKKDGVPLYKLARKGQVVERDPRPVHIYEFSLLNFDSPRASFRMRCTKGTYVRTLCDEIGETLGVGAVLSKLVRTATGALRLADAHALEDILELSPEAFARQVLPISDPRIQEEAPRADRADA